MKTIKLKEINFNNILKTEKYTDLALVKYLQQLLKMEDVNSFLIQPKSTDEENPLLLDNMETAVKTAYDYISNNRGPIFIQVDSDTDGWTSSAILINYFKVRFPNVEVKYRLHQGKEHGVIVDTVPDDCKLVIIPDAGSNELEEHKELKEKGHTIIVLDHHEVDYDYKNTAFDAIIVNNQLSDNFKNKSLSGAGMALKFIELMDKTYFADQTMIYQNYEDLASIGIIADVMDMTNLDNNSIAWYGLSHINNQFIKALVEKQSRGIPNPDSLTKIDVAFYIAPVINGVIRSGTVDDKYIVYNALITANDTSVYKHEWRGKITFESMYENAARIAMNAKSRQDANKKKAFQYLCEIIKENGYDKHNIIIVPLDANQSKNVSPNVTGLIAMELVKEFNKPCLVLRVDESGLLYSGSGRNGIFYNLPDLKKVLNDIPVNMASGHKNAFGAQLTEEQIDITRKYFDEHYNANDFDDIVYEVDYWAHNSDIVNKSLLFNLAQHNWLWGNGISSPLIAITKHASNIIINYMGQNKDTVKLTIDSVPCISFKNPELIAELQDLDNKEISIIGHPQLNNWMGNESVQLIIDDIEISDIEIPDLNLLI